MDLLEYFMKKVLAKAEQYKLSDDDIIKISKFMVLCHRKGKKNGKSSNRK